ncbi:sugar phosphate isomerase/epimerase family protein [Microbacterium cremeum]|uniref:sugar phosphate isomerase/epimerase family protein n=1 Tax=Microbacterium cremeum TaxID=2782169 RepID=UPI001888C45D|nr:sugar phosphate isomerase/epimerase family protein [Microbacterium cremeum]
MTHPLSCHLNVFVPDVRDEATSSALDVIADAGFSHVGLPPFVPAEELPLLARRLGERGLEPIPFVVQRADADVSSADPGVRSAGRRALDDAVEVASALGATRLTGVPYAAYGHATRWTPDDRARAAQEVARFAAVAADRGITVSIEVLNRYETSALTTAAQGLAFLEECGSEHLRLHLDGFHMLIEEADVAAAIAAARPVLGVLEFGQSGRGALQDGGLDVAAAVRAAVADGYDGAIAFEAFSRSVLPESADRLRLWRDVGASPATLAREAARLLGDAVAAGVRARELARTTDAAPQAVPA